MQNTADYIGLANSIVESNDPASYESMCKMLGDPAHIWEIFSTPHGSHNLLFVSCAIFAKKILNREFSLCEDDSESNENDFIDYVARRKLISMVTEKIFLIVLEGGKSLPRHIHNSCLDTISACIRGCIISSSNFNEQFLFFLGVIQPAFIPNEDFIKPNTVTHELVLINPDLGVCAMPEHHDYAVKILSSVLDYITNSTYFDNYYYFRRNIYFFRNHYLAYFLNYAIFSIKVLFRNYNQNLGNASAQKKTLEQLRSSLGLLESVAMYPFSLNMHEAEIEDEIHDNISGFSS